MKKFLTVYDLSKDKTLKSYFNEETNLIVSIKKYGNLTPKLEIGPRVERRGKITKYKKIKRLSIGDMVWIRDIISEALIFIQESEKKGETNE